MPEAKTHCEEPTKTVSVQMLVAEAVFCFTPISLILAQERRAATWTKSRFADPHELFLHVSESPALPTTFGGVV